MLQFTRWTALAGLLYSLAMAAEARADEQRIPVRKLPAAVRKAARAKFPGAVIQEAIKEVEGDETVYELSLKIKGRKVDVAMEDDGTILEVERELNVDELPQAVKHAVAARHPNARITKVETVSRGRGPVRYEIAITTEIILNGQGKALDQDRKGSDEEEEHEVKGRSAKRAHEDRDEDEGERKASAEEREDEEEGKKGEHKAGAKKHEHEDDEKGERKTRARSKKHEHEDRDKDDEKGERKTRARSKKHEHQDSDDDEDAEERERKAKARSKKHQHDDDDDDDDDDADDDDRV